MANTASCCDTVSYTHLNGFGYDPIFFLPEYGCTSAELAPEKKNELSHRGEALRMMRQIMEKKL